MWGRTRNLSATSASSSRASIIFLSVSSIVFSNCGKRRCRGVYGDDPRGPTDPRLDVDGEGGPGSGVLQRSSCSTSQLISPTAVRASGCLEVPAFQAARLSTRSSNPGDESAQIWDERTGLNRSFRPNALSTIFGIVHFRIHLGITESCSTLVV
jgi:hypothetical protein